MLDALRQVWRHEPVRCATVIASAVVFAAAKAGLVIDQQTVVNALLYVVPLVLAGEAARPHVVPVHKLSSDPKALPADRVNVKPKGLA